MITEGHDEAWDVSGMGARTNVWHHVALVYDSDTVVTTVKIGPFVGLYIATLDLYFTE